MDRGDIFNVDSEPTKGREQRGHRPVLVVSKAEFNRLGAPLVCPISTGAEFARAQGWAVSLATAGTQTQGVVLCHQPRVLDLRARNAKRVEAVPEFVIDEVLARLRTILD